MFPWKRALPPWWNSKYLVLSFLYSNRGTQFTGKNIQGIQQVLLLSQNCILPTILSPLEEGNGPNQPNSPRNSHLPGIKVIPLALIIICFSHFSLYEITIGRKLKIHYSSWTLGHVIWFSPINSNTAKVLLNNTHTYHQQVNSVFPRQPTPTFPWFPD